MNFEFDDSDNDDNILFDDDISTDGSKHGKNTKNPFIEHEKKPSNIRKNKIFFFFFKIYFLFSIFRIRFILQVRSIHLAANTQFICLDLVLLII